MSIIVRRVAILVVPMIAAAVARSVIRRVTEHDGPAREVSAA